MVQSAAVVAIPLLPGDVVELVDPEGLQRAHVLAFDSSGKFCTGKLGLKANVKGDELALLLAVDSPGAQKISSKLKQFGIELTEADVAELLTGETQAGTSSEFVSETECIALIAAPGRPMEIGDRIPATDLVAWVQRANPLTRISHELPDPLADTVHDFTIKAASAQKYYVKAGQYIQIMDVEGRQCSDFQCFDLAALDQGREHCLDATATRTMNQSAYPTPGLHSKFFDAQMEPVVEVIQDTCGRHDSFGVACTAKYYDDLGYPGHPNCSDNFNNALADTPVAPRKGWMAINLFFNTFFDDAFQMYCDEPWSRPGDYVLMRALRDMVCVTLQYEKPPMRNRK